MPSNLRERLRATFAWQGDRTDERRFADMTRWWRDASMLAELGTALGRLSLTITAMAPGT